MKKLSYKFLSSIFFAVSITIFMPVSHSYAGAAVVCNLDHYSPSILNMFISDGKGRAWWNDKSDNNPLTAYQKNGFANIRIRWDDGDAMLILNIKTGEASYYFVQEKEGKAMTTANCPIR